MDDYIHAGPSDDTEELAMALQFVVQKLVEKTVERGHDPMSCGITAMVMGKVPGGGAQVMPFSVSIQPVVAHDNETILQLMNVMDNLIAEGEEEPPA